MRYEEPSMDIIRFQSDDVVRTSSGQNSEGKEPEYGGWD